MDNNDCPIYDDTDARKSFIVRTHSEHILTKNMFSLGRSTNSIINAPKDAKDVIRTYQELLNTPRKMQRTYPEYQDSAARRIRITKI
jgi:hypothetical protein